MAYSTKLFELDIIKPGSPPAIRPAEKPQKCVTNICAELRPISITARWLRNRSTIICKHSTLISHLIRANVEQHSL